MPTRVLTWNDLLQVAARPKAANRRITVAGLPARVEMSRANEVGLSVHATAGEDYAADEHWLMRTEREVILLRNLVNAGQVTVDDDVDVWRTAEWSALLQDTSRGCFVGGCTAGPDDIDIRGPVFDDRDRMHKACTPHWEGVHAVLGAQATPETERTEA